MSYLHGTAIEREREKKLHLTFDLCDVEELIEW